MLDLFLSKWNSNTIGQKFTCLLLSCIKQAGGEIRLPIADVASVSDGNTISISFEADTMVLRAATKTETYIYKEPPQSAWQRNAASTTSTSPSATDSDSIPPELELEKGLRHSVPSDAQMAEAEQNVQRLQAMREALKESRKPRPFRTSVPPVTPLR